MPRIPAVRANKPAAAPAAPKAAPAPAPKAAAPKAAAAPAPKAAAPAAAQAGAPAPAAAPVAAPAQAVAAPAKPAAKGRAKAAPAPAAAPAKAAAKGAAAPAKAPTVRKTVDSKNGGALTPPSRAKLVVKSLLNGAVKEFGKDAKATVNYYKCQEKVVKKGEISERVETILEDGKTIKQSVIKKPATAEQIAAAKAFVELKKNVDAYNTASAIYKLCASQTIRLQKDLTPALNAIGCYVLTSVVEHGVSQLGDSKMLTPEHLCKGDVDQLDVWPLLRNSPTFATHVFEVRKAIADELLKETSERIERETFRNTKNAIFAEYGLKKRRPAVAPAVNGEAEVVVMVDGEPMAAAAPVDAPAADADAPAAEPADEAGVPLLFQGVSNHVTFCLQSLRPNQHLRVSKKARALLENLCKEIYESFALGMDELLNTGESKTINLEHMRTLLNLHMHNGQVPKILIAEEMADVPDPDATKAETEAREKAKADGVERKAIAYSELPKVSVKVLTRTLVWPDDTADKIWEFVMNSVQVYNDTLEANKKNRGAADVVAA